MNNPSVGKEQQIVMRRSRKNMFDRIFVFALGTLDPFTTTPLSAIGANGSTFDVTTMAD